MFPPVDTKSPSAVANLTAAAFGRMYPGSTLGWVESVFRDVERLFRGRHPDYAPIDLQYHDLEHTLQATTCLVMVLEGRHAAGAEPRLTPRQAELAVVATLLHDAGYLKLRSDTAGTGAKYTYCHVLRSCAFAASYLPAFGISEEELDLVLGAINCTGPSKKMSGLRFRSPVDRLIGCALATADYLGQMAAPDYPDELEILFAEFRESDEYLRLAPERRAFASATALIANTPAFWETCVRPKLEKDFEAVYRFLARPDGRNPYLEAVEHNIALVAERVRRQHPAGIDRSRANAAG